MAVLFAEKPFASEGGLSFLFLWLFLGLLPLAYGADFPGQLAEKDGSYLGEYPFVSISKPARPVSYRARVVILPISSNKGRHDFAEAAHKQISEFFRAHNYLVPSLLEISAYLRNNEIEETEYEAKFENIAREFRAKYVVFLEVKRLFHTKKINPAGVMAAGMLVTGVGRYANAEYQLRVYRIVEKDIETFSAYERKRDHLLGFWQGSKRMAFKLQEETLAALMNSFAQREIKRVEGYVLEPLRTVFPDSKGFQ
jgi:hypothetical protein